MQARQIFFVASRARRATEAVGRLQHESKALPTGSFDEFLLRFDLPRRIVEVHTSRAGRSGRPSSRRAGRTEEEAGYILAFATNVATMESTSIILDAEDFAGEPMAVVKLPRRVPRRISLGAVAGCKWVPGRPH
jgi:carotenoid cleavage dioxygenase-like enzyme